jgi:hypothetical protein
MSEDKLSKTRSRLRQWLEDFKEYPTPEEAAHITALLWLLSIEVDDSTLEKLTKSCVP